MILIVEDDLILGDVMCELLEEALGVRVCHALNGMQAMALVENFTPELFVFDNQLPDMHGLQLYDYFHMLMGLERIPALIVSANPPWQEIERRQLACLQKPFDLDELISLVQRLLPRAQIPLRA
jgi:CheY-like chemotaxis protein